MNRRLLNVIVCCTPSNGIGAENKLPWRLSNEMKHFASTTIGRVQADKQNVVLMGKNTWQSIPIKFRPLKNRINVVLSSEMVSKQKKENGNPDFVFLSLEEALQFLTNKPEVNEIFVIGGARLYQEVLDKDLVNKIYLTRLSKEFDCDVFFSNFNKDNHFEEIFENEVDSSVQNENGIEYRYHVYKRKSN